MGELGGRYILASETCALDIIGADFVRDLEYCLGSWFGAAMSDETLAEPPAAPVAEPEATATLRGPDARPPDDSTLPASTPDRRASNATLPPTPVPSATVLLTPETAAPPPGAWPPPG